MKKTIRFLIGVLQKLEQRDKVKLADEMQELFHYINKQVFSQIPGVSAIAGFLVGSWVASTFTTSRFRGFLASWGLIKGGTRVVSATTYSLLSISLPILAAALTAYMIQKVMKSLRERQLRRNMARVAQLGMEVQSELEEKLTLLDKVKEAGIISEGEYFTKRANLYQAYARSFPFKFEEFLLKKLVS